jgi:FkbM family methyltransferase
MLITINEVYDVLKKYNIDVTGVFHVGAHDCEELESYSIFGIKPTDIVWIDALDDKVKQAKKRNIPNVYKAVVSDKDDDIVTFRRTNNDQSSSILELGTHKNYHPHVLVSSEYDENTITIDTFVKNNNINIAPLNFWNFDIQGAELKALHGAVESLKDVRAMYLEVNTEEVYKGCGLMSDIDAFLAPYGFTRELTSMTRFHWGDALYVKK